MRGAGFRDQTLRLLLPAPRGLKPEKMGVNCLILRPLQLVDLPSLSCVCAKLLQLCPALFDSMDWSPPGSSVQGLLQARILEWVACPAPGDLPNPGIEPRFPALQMDSLPSEPPGKPFSEDAKLSLGDRVLGEERIALLLYQVKGDTVGSFP